MSSPITLNATYDATGIMGEGVALALYKSIAITDPNANQTETTAITLANAGAGTLSLANSYQGPVTLSGGGGTGTYLLSAASAADEVAALAAIVFTPSATAAGGLTTPTAITTTVTDSAGQSASAATTLTIDPGPSLTPVLPATVEPNMTAVIGTVMPGLSGDALTLSASTVSAGGTVSLQLVNGGEEVIFTAPADIAAGTTDTVSYIVTDQYGDAVSGTATVTLASPQTVTALGASTASAVTGDTVTLTLTPNAAITVTGTPTLLLNDGGSATYAGESGSGALLFTTPVTQGEATPNLTVVGVVQTGVTLSGGTSGVVTGTVPYTTYSTGQGPEGLTVAQVNGTTDLIVANSLDGSVSVFTANGSGGFDTTATVFAAGTGANAVAVATINGTTDLIVTDSGTNAISVFAANGSGGFNQTPTTYAVGNAPVAVAVATINGTTEIVVANQSDNTVSMLAANGRGGLTGVGTYAVAAGAGPNSVAVANVNGTAEIITANYNAASVSVLTPDGSGAFTQQTTYAVGNGPYAVAAGNVNGTTEIATANLFDNSVSVLAANGHGGFGTAQTIANVGPNPDAIAFLDVNGTSELVVSNLNYGVGTPSYLTVLTADRSGAFGNPTTYEAAPYLAGVTAANVNGTLEIFATSNIANTVSVLPVSSGSATTLDLSSVIGDAAGVAVNATDTLGLAATFNPVATVGVGQSLALFSGATITDPNTVGQTDTATITLANASAGRLSLAGSYAGPVTLTAGTAAGTYVLTGAAADVTAALGAVAFTPAAAPGGFTSPTGVTLSVRDTAGLTATATDAVPLVVDSGPSLVPVLTATGPMPVEPDATVVLGTLMRGQPGDALTLSASTASAGGTVSLQTLNGATDVVFTAPASIAASATETVGYTVTDQYGNAVSGGATVALRPAETLTSLTASVAAGSTLVAGDSVTLTLTPSAAVQVTGGVPALSLNDGGTAAYAGETAGGALLFTTTIAAGQSVSDLKVTGIALNGATLAAPAGVVIQPQTYSSDTLVANALFPQENINPIIATIDGTQEVLGPYNGTLISAASIEASGALGPQTTYDLGLGAGTGLGGFTVATIDGTTELLTFQVSYGNDAAGNTTYDGVFAMMPADGSGGFNATARTTYDLGTNNAGFGQFTVATIDGTTEVIVADGTAVIVLAANGHGGFGTAATYDVGGSADAYPTIVTLNGTADLIIGTASGFSVLAADGHGGFGAPTTYATSNGAAGAPINVGNVDGTTELFVRNDFTLDVFAANASGAFALTTADPIPFLSQAIPVNVDGTTDILVHAGNGNTLLVSNGQGGFGGTIALPATSFMPPTVTNINGTTQLWGFSGGQYSGAPNGTLTQLVATAGGTFTTAGTYGLGFGPTSLLVAATNGSNDIIVTNHGDSGSAATSTPYVSQLPVTTSGALTLDAAGVASLAGADTGITVNALCFVTGTRIATPDGEVPVEALRPGDRVCLADGGTAPVRWIGHQTVARRFCDPVRGLPVRIRAGALGGNLPRRDLVLSPGHAVRLGDVLAHAAALVNGVSVLRETDGPERFDYWHVELTTHALLLAEGVAAESFLDDYQELPFDNAAERPAPPADVEELPYPRCRSSRQLPRHVRAMLAERAARLAPRQAAA